MNISKHSRKIAVLAVMTGLSVALVFIIHFPIFPAAPFLEYDPADIPVLICAFAYGPLAGLLVAFIAAVVQGVTVSAHSGLYGIIMHLISTGSFILTAGIIYKFNRSRKGALAGLISGILVSACLMVAANLIITPGFMGVPVDVIKSMLLPVIIPFNLIKSGFNALVTFLLYKRISNLIKDNWDFEIKNIDEGADNRNDR